jgi:hypothetical protein
MPSGPRHDAQDLRDLPGLGKDGPPLRGGLFHSPRGTVLPVGSAAAGGARPFISAAIARAAQWPRARLLDHGQAPALVAVAAPLAAASNLEVAAVTACSPVSRNRCNAGANGRAGQAAADDPSSEAHDNLAHDQLAVSFIRSTFRCISAAGPSPGWRCDRLHPARGLPWLVERSVPRLRDVSIGRRQILAQL